MPAESKSWKVTGKVLESDTREPIRNLLVEVFDQDQSIEERLGSAITDARGEFGLTFEEADFLATRERGTEEIRPDLFCRVRSASGELLAQTEVRKEAGREEAFIILIERSAADTRARFEKDRTILTRVGDTLTTLARHYYVLDAPDEKTRRKKLIALGLNPERARLSAGNGRGPWWNAGASHMNQAIPTRMLRGMGLLSFLDEYRRLACSS